MATSVHDCAVSARRTSRPTKPSDRTIPRSCRRRRTLVASAWPTAARARRPRNSPSTRGRNCTPLRLATSGGGDGKLYTDERLGEHGSHPLRRLVLVDALGEA